MSPPPPWLIRFVRGGERHRQRHKSYLRKRGETTTSEEMDNEKDEILLSEPPKKSIVVAKEHGSSSAPILLFQSAQQSQLSLLRIPRSRQNSFRQRLSCRRSWITSDNIRTSKLPSFRTLVERLHSNIRNTAGGRTR
jgi:hypothetical protein